MVVKLDQDFEHGLYGGQSADPKKIGEALRKRGIERYVFNLDSVGQFDQDFSVWVHESEKDKMPGSLDYSETDGVDPAEVMKEGLKNASLAMARVPPGPGPVVATLRADGSAAARRVSPQDFIEGKALDA